MKIPPRDILLVAALILISRIPFLFSGYGSEEDAWGLILTARNISQSGIYEVSRMPGHPVQELLLSLLWQLPAWLLNLFTAVISTAGIAVFMLTLKKLNITGYIPAGIALAFVPAVYINSSNVMDYTWAMSLTMCSFYLLTQKRIIAAGIMTGIAAGFRITALGMALPLAMLILDKSDPKSTLRLLFMFWIIAGVTALIVFLPPYLTYGPGFFMYYQYFPDPPFLKNAYKATIGAWGLIGFAALVIAGVAAGIKAMAGSADGTADKQMNATTKRLLILSFVVMVMYAYAYFRLPQKSAFVIPAAPFVILMLAILIKPVHLKWFAGAMIVSSLFFGVNLDDPNRGSERSPLSFGFTAAGSTAAVDILYGPVIADQTKRENKIAYAKKVADQTLDSGKKTVIIAGWFQNEIEFYLLEKQRANLVTVYYADKSELESYRQNGFDIYHLPEQDKYNDLRYKGDFTSEFSAPFPDSLN
jgi:hypothetical protein